MVEDVFPREPQQGLASGDDVLTQFSPPGTHNFLGYL
jgi:hypothetical protein